MPEGDTIFRAAMSLRKVLQGQIIQQASGHFELKNLESIVGCKVLGIESRGKHLIVHFSDQRALHSHLGMTGSWHIYRKQDVWQKPKIQATAILQTADWVVVCFSPTTIRLLTERQLLRDPYLQKLGPDLLGPPITDDVFLKRIRSQNEVAIGEAMMNQTVVAGIGNVYKSEILFLQQIHPLIKVGELNDRQLLDVRDLAVKFMKLNLTNGSRQTRFRSDSQKLWVYGRKGDACLKCSEAILMLRQGDLARSTYFCPACQAGTLHS
ncbi:MAG: DNA-formamidopyrimidine glycosylase family protein [Fuerstiella sp.]